jgi:hypothetical protein
MSVIFEINRDFPYQVALSFDEIAMEVLAWLDERSFEWDMYVSTEVAQPELTSLVSFKGTNGAQPSGSLIADHHGDLSGTTAFGGANGDGTVFEITGSGFSTHKTPSYSVVESHDSFVFAWQRYRILAEPLKPGRLRRSAQDRERKTDCDRDG